MAGGYGVRLGIVSGEGEAARLPERSIRCWPVKPVRPVDLVEDELILALPVVARHEDDDDCVPQEALVEDVPKEQERRKDNPFAALKALRGGKDRDFPGGRTMAVQQNRKTRSKRGMRRAHDPFGPPVGGADHRRNPSPASH